MVVGVRKLENTTVEISVQDNGCGIKSDNLKKAINRLDVPYPVAQDNDRHTWSAYNNRYWPTLYLIDKQGHIPYKHIGEGAYEETETAIRKLRKLSVRLFNQAVLLKNVNDDPDVLTATFSKLCSLGIQPYYLFQARPVKGASHFQVPLRRGIEIVRIREGRIVERWGEWDGIDLLVQLGRVAF